MKIKYLYHGSARQIEGNYLLPKKAHDLENRAENLHTAIYASSNKEISIAMAIISCNGVNLASLSFRKKPYGIIYEGWPKQKYIYLYTLPTESFIQSKRGSRQWHSLDKVKPLKVQKMEVKKYLRLIRKGTKKEIEAKKKKYGIKDEN